MSYAKFEIIRPLYALQKKVASTSLRAGDRFVYPKHETLLFKTTAAPVEGKYLCCDEAGKIEWIDGEERVTKINGVTYTLQSCSRQFKAEYLKHITLRK